MSLSTYKRLFSRSKHDVSIINGLTYNEEDNDGIGDIESAMPKKIKNSTKQSGNISVISRKFNDLLELYEHSPQYIQFCCELFELGSELNKIYELKSININIAINEKENSQNDIFKLNQFLVESLPIYIERLYKCKQEITNVLSKEILYGASLTLYEKITNYSNINDHIRELIYFKLKSRITMWNQDKIDRFKTMQHKNIKRLYVDNIPMSLFIEQMKQQCNEYVSKFESKPQWLRDQFIDMVSEIDYFSDIEMVSTKNNSSIVMQTPNSVNNNNNYNSDRVKSLSFIGKLDLESGMNCESSENSVEMCKPIPVIISNKNVDNRKQDAKKIMASRYSLSSQNNQLKMSEISVNGIKNNAARITCFGKSMDKWIPLLYMLGPLCLLLVTVLFIVAIVLGIPLFVGHDTWFATSKTLM